MKIDYDLQKEKEAMDKLVAEALSKGKAFSLVGIYEKLEIVQRIWEKLGKGKSVTLAFDNESKNYPEILKKYSPPRIVLQKNDEKVMFEDFLSGFQKQGFDLNLENKAGIYLLTIKKSKEEPLDFGVKLNRDKTIDLSLISENKKKEEIFTGIRTYYDIKKRE